MSVKHIILSMACSLVLMSNIVAAAPVIYKASGAAPADIQTAVDQFRAELGEPVNGAIPGSQPSGRREINWDGVPDSFAAPNKLPFDFFNNNSPRGVKFLAIGNGFQVSGKSGVAPVRFDNIRSGYSSVFQTFSAERLFTTLGNNFLEVHFFVPGDALKKAAVNSFGAVFADVDKGSTTTVEYISKTGVVLYKGVVPVSPFGGLSFLGVYFDAGERVAKVRITNGNAALHRANSDSYWQDLVTMDDFIYGEPQL
ncbi:MAG: hypothetical protein ACXWTS_06375 [Methylococcaceae bacterium]